MHLWAPISKPKKGQDPEPQNLGIVQDNVVSTSWILPAVRAKRTVHE